MKRPLTVRKDFHVIVCANTYDLAVNVKIVFIVDYLNHEESIDSPATPLCHITALCSTDH